jgi:hypothetical protein
MPKIDEFEHTRRLVVAITDAKTSVERRLLPRTGNLRSVFEVFALIKINFHLERAAHSLNSRVDGVYGDY